MSLGCCGLAIGGDRTDRHDAVKLPRPPRAPVPSTFAQGAEMHKSGRSVRPGGAGMHSARPDQNGQDRARFGPASSPARSTKVRSLPGVLSGVHFLCLIPTRSAQPTKNARIRFRHGGVEQVPNLAPLVARCARRQSAAV
jgi:hypothetical protein